MQSNICKSRDILYVFKTLVIILRLQDSLNLLFFLDDCWRLRNLLTEDVSLEEVWEPDSEFIRDETLCWN